jgi:ribonuclease P protein component
VLPKNARLNLTADFARATKSGTRVTSEHFVGYLYISPAPAETNPPKFGLIVNKAML